jgi:hypothetical protein
VKGSVQGWTLDGKRHASLVGPEDKNRYLSLLRGMSLSDRVRLYERGCLRPKEAYKFGSSTQQSITASSTPRPVRVRLCERRRVGPGQRFLNVLEPCTDFLRTQPHISWDPARR